MNKYDLNLVMTEKIGSVFVRQKVFSRCRIAFDKVVVQALVGENYC